MRAAIWLPVIWVAAASARSARIMREEAPLAPAAGIVERAEAAGISVAGLDRPLTDEAMARGACIVSTPIGVEGIDDAGEASAIATTPEDFASAILDLARDRERRTALGRAAREKLVREFSWESIVERLTALANEVRAGR